MKAENMRFSFRRDRWLQRALIRFGLRVMQNPMALVTGGIKVLNVAVYPPKLTLA